MTIATPTTAFARLRNTVNAQMLAGMDDHIGRLAWNARRIEAFQRDRLRALLGHAIEHSPFHRARLSGIDAAHFELTDLAVLPVMTKAEMMDNLDAVFTDPRLTAATVERALAATMVEPVPLFDEYVAMSSGGSSGRRGVFVLDGQAAAEFFSCLMRSGVARLRELGVHEPLPVAMVAAASAVHATGAAPAWSENAPVGFRMLPVPVTLPLPQIVDRLNALNAPALYGYPSMLARLAAEQRAGRLRIAPMIVTSTSETLLPELRAAIAEGFRAPIIDTFGSTEGLVGTSEPDGHDIVFNSDVCIVELVDHDTRPVPDGVASDKVLVTNLSNRVQPLIRYELTDSFIRRPSGPESGHLHATVQGRTDEVLHFENVDVHPLVVRSVLCKTPEVGDYQVRQTPYGIAVDALPVAAFDEGDLHDRLDAALAAAGLAHADISVRTVASLPRHPETGKLRRFVPLP